MQEPCHQGLDVAEVPVGDDKKRDALGCGVLDFDGIPLLNAGQIPFRSLHRYPPEPCNCVMLLPVVLNQAHNRARLYQSEVKRQRLLMSALCDSALLKVLDPSGWENSVQSPTNGDFTSGLVALWAAHPLEVGTGRL